MSATVYNLEEQFNNYNLIKNAENIEKNEIENQYLRVLYTLQGKIHEQLGLKYINKIKDLEVHTFSFSSTILNFLVMASALETFTTSFIFGLGLIAIIPAITQPILLSSTILFAVLDTFIACSFQVSYLSQCMGIKSNAGILRNIDEYMTELELLNDICTQLQHRNWKPDNEDYEKFCVFFEKMLEDLERNTAHIIEYKPSEFLNNMKYFITFFGIASTVASSYFMSNLIIDSLAVHLGHVISPECAAIFITIIVLANVLTYLLATHYSLSNLFEPGLEKVNHFKDNYRLFKDNQENLKSTRQNDLQCHSN